MNATAAKKTAKLAPAAAAPARPATLAEVLDSKRSEFQGTVAYKRRDLAKLEVKFNSPNAAGLLYAIEAYGGELAKHQAIVEVWAVFEAAYLPDDATGATWVTLSNLANRMIMRLLSDAAGPTGCSDLIRAGVEVQKAAGRAAAIREIRSLIDFVEAKIAHAAPDAAPAAIA